MNHTMNKGKTIMQAGKKVVDTSHGFTLVEVMTVLVIISILALFAAPEVINWRPKMRLKRAADTLSENLQRAKMHAIKNNVSVVFTFTPGAGAPCKGGSYLITESLVVTNVVVPLETMADNVCLQATTFVATDGFTARGLPINPALKTVTLSNADLQATGDPTFRITQSIAGGLKLDKVPL
jgi:prepilin-type N-terminal cleavage/methylation domain-containing protein